MKRLLVILLLLCWHSNAFAIETTIRVLGVTPSHVTGQVTYMQAQLEFLRQSWINTQMPTSSGVSGTASACRNTPCQNASKSAGLCIFDR